MAGCHEPHGRMSIIMPDPHPGRCRNLRMHGTETLRCLDYEAVPHVCVFPKSRPQIPQTGIYSTTAINPKPWKKPGGDQ